MVLLEVAAGVGGSIAFAKFCAPFLYQECFAPTHDDELVQRPANERSPLLVPGSNGASPRQNSLRLAAQLYSAHLTSSVASSSNPSRAVSESGASTPVSTAPTSPISHSSSYFDLKHPPLYVKDVSAALEREARRRNSAGASNVDSPRMLPIRPPLMRGYSSSSSASTVASASRPTSSNANKSVSDDSSHLLAALICLLHCPDLNDFFLSGKYLDEDVRDKQHRAVIDAFAATAQQFWPSPDAPLAVGQQQPDLSVFHALLRNKFVSTAPTPLSCSPASSLSSTPLSSAHTLVNATASPSPSGSGANTVSHLLRSLHVALNEGEYTADQPTYLRESYRLGGDSEAFRKHVGSLRNMSLIQEDSIVRDMFEGLVCVEQRCGACDETVIAFESFLALPLPTDRAGDRSLPALIKTYERPAPTPTPLYCSQCRSYQTHTETRKIWNLPEILVFQLPTPTTTGAQQQHRMSRSSEGKPYPMAGLDMAKFNGESASRASSVNLSDDGAEYPDEEELYDLFAVRECLGGGKSYRAIARDGASEWSAFDALTGAASPIYIRDVVTPAADLLFYRRRDM